jgi:hypothetical protein
VTRNATLVLTLALALCQPAPTHDLAALSVQQAAALEGEVARFRVAPSNEAEHIDGHTALEVDDGEADGVMRSAWLDGLHEVDGPAIVSGTLRVIRHAAWTTQTGEVVPGFVELRVEGAKVEQ